MNYKDIKSFEDACTVENVDSKALPDVSMIPKKHQKSILAFFMLSVIISAINRDEEGKYWEPDWHTKDEYKYFAWFGVKASKANPAGSGFSYSYYDYSDAITRVGSRLCFKSADRCNYARTTFENLYKDYLLM